MQSPLERLGYKCICEKKTQQTFVSQIRIIEKPPTVTVICILKKNNPKTRNILTVPKIAKQNEQGLIC